MAKIVRKNIALDETRDRHSAKKYKCPACGQKRFVKYFDFETGEYLEDKYGRCDREEHCGYFEAPYEDLKKDFYEKREMDNQGRAAQRSINRNWQAQQKQPAKVIKAVPKEIVTVTLQFYETNILTAFLYSKLGPQLTNEAIARYYIGTGKGGSTIFWQIDRFMRTRTAQKIKYTPTGNRDKSEFPTRIFKNEDGYTPCIFGEHLLFTIGERLPIAIVESEKTAVIASAYLPTLNGKPVIWMASVGVNGLTFEKIQVLANRDIILVPDFSFHARATWGQIPMRKKKNDKGQNIPHPDGDLIPDFIPYSQKLTDIGCNVRFFDPAPDVWDSSDIADVLLTMPPPITTAPKPVKPDLSKYRLPGTGENAQASHRTAPNLDDTPTIDTNILHGEFSFKITGKGQDGIKCTIEPENLTGKVENWLNKPEIRNLIEKLDICEGSISPYIPNEHTTEPGTRDEPGRVAKT